MAEPTSFSEKMDNLSSQAAMILQANEIILFLLRENVLECLCRIKSNDRMLRADFDFYLGCGDSNAPVCLLTDSLYALIEARNACLTSPGSHESLSDFEILHSKMREFMYVPVLNKTRDANDLVTGAEAMGVAFVFDKRYDQSFNADDLRLAEMLFDSAGTIIAEEIAG